VGLVAQSNESPPGKEEGESEGDASASTEGGAANGEAAEHEGGSSGDSSSGVERDEASAGGGEKQPPRERKSGGSGAGERGPREDCDGFMGKHGESAARKLYRALSGNDYQVRKLGLGSTFEAEVSGADRSRSKVRFEVRTENDGRSAVLVPADHSLRRTLIVASTSNGPVIAVHRWPERSEITSRGDCKPTGTRIAHPEVPADAVELEPFDFWGVRVLWRIPSNFRESEPSVDQTSEAIRAVLSASGE